MPRTSSAAEGSDLQPVEAQPEPAPGTVFERVRPAYQQVADQLQGAILRGTVSPGDRLPTENELAATFGVSRGTVREALRLLASQNLIYSVRGAGGGTFIAETDPVRISTYLETSLGLLSGSRSLSSDDLLEVRELLEVRAARLAAIRRTPAHLAELREAIELEKTESRRAPRLGLTQHFHEVLLDAAGNKLLAVLTTPVFKVIHARFREDVPTTTAWPDLDGDHDEILALITAGDADGAAQAMRDHLDKMWTAAAGSADHLQIPTDADVR